MKTLRLIGFCFLALTSSGFAMDDFLDRVDEALTINAFHDTLRARFSGTLDLEYYHFQQPPPGLIYSDSNDLFNERLTLFLDAQIGPHIYLFAQARVDRGFDPSESSAQVRLDEIALRLSPWDDGRFILQAGKFATVVGNWVARHESWENPFITAPLPYESLTGIWDSSAPYSVDQLLHWAHTGGYNSGDYSDKYLRNPIVWGPDYASGVSVAGRLGKFDYAVEMKNTSLSSRPESWDATRVGFDYPTFSARAGFRPNTMWNLGFSASNGTYLLPEAAPSLPPGASIGDYRELVLGQDISFAWHHLQLWAEFYEARFEVPRVGNADTFSYYIEAKYKFTPQFFGALRWNQQLYATVANGEGRRSPWGNDLSRIDVAAGYRFTAHMQLKLQYSLLHEDSRPDEFSHLAAVQFTLRF